MAKQPGGGASGKKSAGDNRKNIRARSHASAQERHTANGKAQAVREVANKDLRTAGTPTPWEAACAARRARRTLAGRKGLTVVS